MADLIARRRRDSRRLKLPHERDESAEPSSGQDSVVRQAARDVASGQIDTDNYTRAAGIAKTVAKKRRLPP